MTVGHKNSAKMKQQNPHQSHKTEWLFGNKRVNSFESSSCVYCVFQNNFIYDDDGDGDDDGGDGDNDFSSMRGSLCSFAAKNIPA